MDILMDGVKLPKLWEILDGDVNIHYEDCQMENLLLVRGTPHNSCLCLLSTIDVSWFLAERVCVFCLNRTHCLNMAKKKNSLKIWRILQFFPNKKPMYNSHWVVFCLHNANIRPQKKNWLGNRKTKRRLLRDADRLQVHVRYGIPFLLSDQGAVFIIHERRVPFSLTRKRRCLLFQEVFLGGWWTVWCSAASLKNCEMYWRV
jgi:hypothetical protein